ncbi:MAG: ABC transporter substrate-binding protein [Jatrophihabitans sp.]
MISLRRRISFGVAVTLPLALLAACGGGSTGTKSGSGKRLDTLVIANAVKIDTLDPQQNALNESIWLDQDIYSRLVQADPTGTKITPDLPTSWDISADNLTYTFHMRDAKFADGSPVTAQDAVWSIDRARKYDGGWGFLLQPVKSITATDAKTVVISLTKPHSPLLADLAIYAYAVLPQKAVQAEGDKFFTHAYGSGPYKVGSYKPDSEVDLVQNDNFYGAKSKIKTVKIMVVTNDNTRVLDLQAKKVDVIENPPGNLTTQIQSNKDLRVDLFPSTRVDFIQMSGKDQHFNDMRVRQAVRYALDLDQVNKLAYQNNAVPATSFMPYKMLYWDDSLPKPAVDLGKAKDLMKQAGYADGFATNLITTSGDAAGQAEAVVIKDNLAKIGIKVTIESYEQVTAYDKVRTGKYGMAERYWTNDIIDPDEVVSFGADVNAGSESFDTFWNNPKAIALVAQARSATDPAQRADLYKQIQQIVWDETPFLPVAYAPYRYASGKWVTGFKVSPLGNYNDALLDLTVAAH